MVHGEIELAKAELSASCKNAGTGAGFFIGAAVATLLRDDVHPDRRGRGLGALWVYHESAAYLIVFGFLCLVVGILVLAGYAEGQEGQGTGAHHFGDQGDRRVPSEPDPIHIVTE